MEDNQRRHDKASPTGWKLVSNCLTDRTHNKMDTDSVRDLIPGYAIKARSIKSGVQMAKPNYSYEKRQKEIAKKKKQEEKRKRKQGVKNKATAEGQQKPE
ncbi:MAG: hypothetical protein U9P12_06595 [Verrucomicrobiota bacterium]|nr:hypothetical protein [Verrucomicrobiota bacterium]